MYQDKEYVINRIKVDKKRFFWVFLEAIMIYGLIAGLIVYFLHYYNWVVLAFLPVLSAFIYYYTYVNHNYRTIIDLEFKDDIILTTMKKVYHISKRDISIVERKEELLMIDVKRKGRDKRFFAYPKKFEKGKTGFRNNLNQAALQQLKKYSQEFRVKLS